MPSPRDSLILEIQEDIARQRSDVVAIVRKALIASKKLGLSDLSEWMDRELNGYFDCPEEQVPQYRKIGAIPRFFNPYCGWCPIIIQDDELRELFMRLPIRQPIGEVNRLSKSDGSLHATYATAMENFLREQMDIQFDIRAHISPALIASIPDAVNNTILDWALELERSGVLGEGMSFSEEERKGAAAVTQHIYAQNIGTVGNISDNAHVENTQSAGQGIDRSVLEEITRQVRAALPLLPEPAKNLVSGELSALATDGARPDRAAERLKTIRSVCEQIAGNVGAAGIVALIGKALGA